MAQHIRFGEFWFLYRQTFLQMRKLVFWLPLIIYGTLLIGLALIHFYLFSPVFKPVLSGWINLLYAEYSEAYFHYPNHFMLLPLILDRSSKALFLIVQAFFFGVTSDLFISLYRGAKPAFAVSFGRAIRLYLKLTLTWAVVLGLLYFVSSYYYDFLENGLGIILQNSPRRLILALFSLHFLIILIYSPFVYLIPSIVAGRASFAEIVGRAIKTSFRHPFATFGIVFIPYVITALPGIPLSFSPRVIELFSPELLFYLIMVVIIISIFTNFILMGTSAKFYMDQNES